MDLIDVSIVNRVLPFVNPHNSSKHIPSAAVKEKDKINKYRDHGIVSNHNGNFIPFVIENFGKIGDIGYKYIIEASQHFDKGYKASTIRRYWFSLLSVSLHKTLGQFVHQKLCELQKGKLMTTQELDEELIQEECYELMDSGVKRGSISRGLRKFK